MIIAQITDVHLGFEPRNPDEINRIRLDRTLKELAHSTLPPDMVLATGDLTDHGDLHSYEALRDAFSGFSFPVWPCLGNHDLRDNFRTVFPHIPVEEGFVQYVVEQDGLRIVILDTLIEGRHGGGFCEVRAAWLARQLAAAPDQPTLVVMHHPPVQVGIGWMDPLPDEPWIQRFRGAIKGHKQIRAILCGHLHRPIMAPFEGVPLFVCPATAVQLGLDLRPIDPNVPDNRAMITLDPSCYGLHRWESGQLACHYAMVSDEKIVARFDEKMQPLVQELMSERPI